MEIVAQLERGRDDDDTHLTGMTNVDRRDHSSLWSLALLLGDGPWELHDGTPVDHSRCMTDIADALMERDSLISRLHVLRVKTMTMRARLIDALGLKPEATDDEIVDACVSARHLK